MELVLFVSTGRCGTKFLSESIRDKRSYICHEVEHPSAKDIMRDLYIPLAINADKIQGRKIIKEYKLPQIRASLKKNKKVRYIDTGHQYNYGLFSPILEMIPSTKLVRLRRSRYETALSFLTTPPENDIWNTQDYNGYFRWMMSPKFKIAQNQNHVLSFWNKLTRLQKVIWAIDEVERMWLDIIDNHNVSYIEMDFEDIKVNNFSKLEAFLDVKVKSRTNEKSKNSSSFWNREKPNISHEEFTYQDKELLSLYNSQI